MKNVMFFFLTLCLGGELSAAVTNYSVAETLFPKGKKKLPVAKVGGNGDYIYDVTCNSSSTNDYCINTTYNSNTNELRGTYNLQVDFSSNTSCPEELNNIAAVIFDIDGNIIGQQFIIDAGESCEVHFRENSCSTSGLASVYMSIPLLFPLGCDGEATTREMLVWVELMSVNGNTYTPVQEYFDTEAPKATSCLNEIFPSSCFGDELSFAEEDLICFECKNNNPTSPFYDPDENPLTNPDYSNLRRRAPEHMVTLAPNPFQELMTVVIETPLEEEALLEVYSIHGQKIHTQQVLLNSGKNQVTLETFDFDPGSYFLNVHTSNTSKVLKAVKSN